jgi:glycosyltransferase involved in cell wall biosynthesis
VKNIAYSIIVPAYNEEEDIVSTLESLIRLEGPKEIIIVDDASTDSTAKIVSSYQNKGVRLLQQRENKGRCEARNRGITEAQGDVVIILNADVQLPLNFLNLLDKHYSAGADYVLVDAKISNTDKLFPRYLQSQHEWLYHDADWIQWTEGFSCKKSAALAAGLFPSGFPIPLTSGEDGYFGDQLKLKGFKKVIDTSIAVTHIAPASFKGYWHQRVERGFAVPLVWRFLDNISRKKIYWRLVKAFPGNLAALILLIPLLKNSFSISKHSPKGFQDFFGFFYAAYVEQVATFWGEWKAFFKLGKVG